LTYNPVSFLLGCGVWIIQTLNYNAIAIEAADLAAAHKKNVVRVLLVDGDSFLLDWTNEKNGELVEAQNSSLQFQVRQERKHW
jgi:hypothetical protein